MESKSFPKDHQCSPFVRCYYESENQIHVINVPTESIVFSSPVLSQSASQIVLAAPYLAAIVGNEVLLWDITKNKGTNNSQNERKSSLCSFHSSSYLYVAIKLDYSGSPKSLTFSNNQRLAIASDNMIHVYDVTASFMLFKITDTPV